MFSHSFISMVNRMSPYWRLFVGFTALGGAMYGGHLGYKASVSAPDYKKLECIAFGSIAGGLYGPSFVLLLPLTTTIYGIPEFKVTYDADNGESIVSLIPKKWR